MIEEKTHDIIYPLKNTFFYKKLNNLENNLSNVNFSQIFFFSGKLVYPELRAALETTLHRFDFLFCQLVSEDEPVIEYDASNTKYNIKLQKSILNKPVVSDIFEHDAFFAYRDIKEQEIFLPDILDNASAMFHIKIVEFTDGFSVGLTYNHCVVDNSSALSFMKSLSGAYLSEVDLTVKPKIYDAYEIKKMTTGSDKKNSLSCFSNKEKKVEYNNGAVDNLTSKENDRVCAVIFNEHTLKKIQQSTDYYISKVDIINAFLLKMLAQDNKNDNNIISLIFSCDMRKFFNLNESAVGCLVGSVQSTIGSRKAINNMSVSEVAKIIRIIVNDVTEEGYFKYLDVNATLAKDDFLKFSALNSDTLLTTSWTNALSKNLNLGEDAELISIESKLSTMPSIGVICERKKIYGIDYVVFFNTSEKVLAAAEMISNNKDLFTIHDFGSP